MLSTKQKTVFCSDPSASCSVYAIKPKGGEKINTSSRSEWNYVGEGEVRMQWQSMENSH